MTRVIAFAWVAVAALTAWGLFQVKVEVQQLESELRGIRQATAADREAIEILTAEWSYLNQPGRIADLAGRHLGLQTLQPAQVVPLGQLAARLSPQPDSATPVAGAATLASAKTEQ